MTDKQILGIAGDYGSDRPWALRLLDETEEIMTSFGEHLCEMLQKADMTAVEKVLFVDRWITGASMGVDYRLEEALMHDTDY